MDAHCCLLRTDHSSLARARCRRRSVPDATAVSYMAFRQYSSAITPVAPCGTSRTSRLCQGVKLNDPSLAPESPEEARRPCTTAGIWHFMYDVDLKIADVWFLRELSTDEFHRKVRTRP